MARIKLNLPDRFNFSIDVPLRISDINYGGHLGNDAILSIMHEARLAYLDHYGFSELQFAGTSLIMGDTAIIYKSEGFHGDVVVVEVTSAEFSEIGFDLYYKLSKKANGDEVAHAKTGMICFNYDTRKVSKVPTEAREKLEA